MSSFWRVEAAGIAVGGALARQAPLAPTQALLAAGARRAFDRGGKRARWALTNLRIAYPDAPLEELRAIGRESFVHAAWNAFDELRAERWNAAELLTRFELRGLEHLERALARGGGAFVLTLHMGNFDLAGRSLGARGIGVNPVARRQRNPYLWARLSAQRARFGIENIDHRHALKDILGALRRGRSVVILLDQYSRRSQGVLVPLFGKRCSTSAGLALIALRGGAPIVPGYVLRDGPDHHVMQFEPELEPPPASGDRNADVLALTARANQVLEAMIRKHPEQWLWAHRRFRHSPDLPDGLY